MASGQAPEPEEHGISQKAIEVAPLGKFPITNSMILSWVVALGLILFAQLATRDMQQVPSGAQNLLEWIVEGLYKFLEGIIGAHLVDRTFWFFATIFILFFPPTGWRSFQG
jgi:F-type H+-transporting ATPase subunit a